MQDQETCKGRLLREEEAQQDNKGSEQTRIKNSPERLSHQKPVTFIVFQNADEKNVICGETPKSAETELLEDNRVKITSDRKTKQGKRRKKQFRKTRKMTIEEETSKRSNSHSRSRSVSYDARSTSRKGFFSQSFDSKLSEFSENEMVVLQKRKKIDEYLGEVKPETLNFPLKNSRVKSIESNPQKNNQDDLEEIVPEKSQKPPKKLGLCLQIPELAENSEEEQDDNDSRDSLGVGHKRIRGLLKPKFNSRKNVSQNNKGSLTRRNITFAKEDEDDKTQYNWLQLDHTKTNRCDIQSKIRPDKDPYIMLETDNNKGTDSESMTTHQITEKELVHTTVPEVHQIKSLSNKKQMTLDFGIDTSEEWDRRAPPAPRSRRMKGFERNHFPIEYNNLDMVTKEQGLQKQNNSQETNEENTIQENIPKLQLHDNNKNIFDHPQSNGTEKFTTDLLHIENPSKPMFPIVGSSWKSSARGKKAPNAPRNNKKVSFNFGAHFLGQNRNTYFAPQKNLELVISEGNSDVEMHDNESGDESLTQSEAEAFDEVELHLPEFGDSKNVIKSQNKSSSHSDREHSEKDSSRKITQNTRPNKKFLSIKVAEQIGPKALKLESGESKEHTQQDSHRSNSNKMSSKDIHSRGKLVIAQDFEESHLMSGESKLKKNLFSPRNAFAHGGSEQHMTHSSSAHSSRKQNQQITNKRPDSGPQQKRKNNQENKVRGNMLEIEIEEANQEEITEMSSNSPRHCSQMEISEESRPSQTSSNSGARKSKRRIRIQGGPNRPQGRNHMTFGQNQKIKFDSNCEPQKTSQSDDSAEPLFQLPVHRFAPKTQQSHSHETQNSENEDQNQIFPNSGSEEQPVNFEIKFDPKLLEVGSKRDIQQSEQMSGCRTNPLPTCKNADRRKRGGFVFEGFRPQKKKFQMNLAIGDMSDLATHKDQGLRIEEEESFEEAQSSPKNNIPQPPYLPKKRNLKLKINSKNSNGSPKNYSRQSSHVVNSIQMNSLENNFIISPKCGNSLSPGVKHLDAHAQEGLESIQMSDGSNSITGDGLSRSVSRHPSHRGSGRSLKPMKLILKSQQNLGLILSDKQINIDTSLGEKIDVGDVELAQSESKPRRRKVQDRRWSKKTSMLSGNKSSLLSSGVGGSVSIGFRTGLGEEEIEEIAILKKQLEKSEKRVNKIIKDNKRRNETYKRLWDTQNQKIKELEDTVQRVNSESNEMKKDIKIMVELRNFLQKKVAFLEEENRRLRERSSNPNNLIAQGHETMFNINQRGWGEQSPTNPTKNLHIVETEMIGIMHSPIRNNFQRPEIKHYTSNNESAMNSIDHKHGSPEKSNYVLGPQVLSELTELAAPNPQLSIEISEDFRAGPHNTLVENSYEAVRRAREKVKLNELQIIIPEENEEGYASSRELNLTSKSSVKRQGNHSKRKIRVQIKPKTFIIDNPDVPWGLPDNYNSNDKQTNSKPHILNQKTPDAEQGWADFHRSKKRSDSPQIRIPQHRNQPLKQPKSKTLNQSQKKSQYQINSTKKVNKKIKTKPKNTHRPPSKLSKKIGILIPDTHEEPVLKVQSTRVNKKIYFDHHNGGLSFSKKLPKVAKKAHPANSSIKGHRPGQHSQSQFRKMKEMIMAKRRKTNKTSLAKKNTQSDFTKHKKAKAPHKVSWRNLKMSSQTNLPPDPAKIKSQIAFTSHKRIVGQNLSKPTKDSAYRRKVTKYSNRKDKIKDLKSHTPKISFTGIDFSGTRLKKVKKRRKTAIGSEGLLKHYKARSIVDFEASRQKVWGYQQEYNDIKPAQTKKKKKKKKITKKYSETSSRLYESQESLGSEFSKRRHLMERVQTEPMSIEVEGEYFKEQNMQNPQHNNNCSISVNEVCFENPAHLERLQYSNPTSKVQAPVEPDYSSKPQIQSKIMSTGKLAKDIFGSSLKLAKVSSQKTQTLTPNYQKSHKEQLPHFKNFQPNDPLNSGDFSIASSKKKSKFISNVDQEKKRTRKQRVFRHNSRSPNFSKSKVIVKDNHHNKRKVLSKRQTDFAWQNHSAREAGMETDRTGKRVKELKRKLRVNQTGKQSKTRVRGMRLSVTSGKDRSLHHKNKNHVFQQSLKYYQKQQSLRNRRDVDFLKNSKTPHELDFAPDAFRQAIAQKYAHGTKPAWVFQKSEIIGERSPKNKVVGAKKKKKKRPRKLDEHSSVSAYTHSTKQSNRNKKKNKHKNKIPKNSKKKRHKIPQRKLNFKKAFEPGKSETPKFNIVNNIQIEQLSNDPLESLVDGSQEAFNQDPLYDRPDIRMTQIMNNTFEQKVDGQVLHDLQNNFYSCKNIPKDLNLHEQQTKHSKKLSFYSELEERPSLKEHHSEHLSDPAKKVLNRDFFQLPLRMRKKKY